MNVGEICHIKTREEIMRQTSSETSLRALHFRSTAVAQYLSERSSLPRQELDKYREEVQKLRKRMSRLIAGNPDLHTKEIELKNQCESNIRAIEVRLGFIQANPINELKHLRARLRELESQLTQTMRVGETHGNLMIPGVKAQRLQDEFEKVQVRIKALDSVVMG